MKKSKERFSLFTLHFSLAAALMVLLLMACANMGTPDGGPYDETAPTIVRTSPKYGETKSSAKKVVIEFDEIVKIENAQEKVIVSPPQVEQPEIEAIGKKVIVTLLDTLKPDMTYTIDFADAITDNNEGNPYGDYAFTFSTGSRIDTMQVSGNVLEAEDLEPIKGMLVGLYKVGGNEEGDSVVNELPDSVFRTKPFERISRTDSRGHFVIKGLSPGKYRVFALDDKNQNFVYDQKSEKIAVSELVYETSSKPDVRHDTIWHDSIYYDSIVPVPYTHYYPDDIVLLAFQTAAQDRYKVKEERPELHKFTICFSTPSDTLPLLTGLNFDSSKGLVVESGLNNDSITYWIKDSLIYNIDTLEMRLDFYATDSTGSLSLTCDTLRLVSKISKEKVQKQKKEKWDNWVKTCKQKAKEERRAAKRSEGRKEEDASEELVAVEDTLQTETSEVEPTEGAGDGSSGSEEKDSVENGTSADESEIDATKDASDKSENDVTEDKAEKAGNDTAKDKSDKSEKKKKGKSKKDDDIDIDIPPMPEEFLVVSMTNGGSMAPDQNVVLDFEEPIDTFDLSKIHFSVKVDSLYKPEKFIFKQVPGNIKSYRLYAEWEPDTTYQLEIDTAAFVSIYGKRCEASKLQIKIKSLDDFSTLFVTLQNADSTAIVQLMDASGNPKKSVKTKKGKADFYFMNPGDYYMRVFYDKNNNGKWDTGDYDTKLLPEPVYYYPSSINLKAKWEISQSWDPTAVPLSEQKPEKLIKQKPEKDKKTMKNKNKERERLKREGKNGESSSSSSNGNSFF